jgi:hypothetical protein
MPGIRIEKNAMGQRRLSSEGRGVVTGCFTDSNGVNHGFARNGDRYQTIDVPGADFTAPQGINSEGTSPVSTAWAECDIASC